MKVKELIEQLTRLNTPNSEVSINIWDENNDGWYIDIDKIIFDGQQVIISDIKVECVGSLKE
jgi:hypothetical protein